MITAETVNHVLQFEGSGLPVISLYVPIDPGTSRKELHTRVESLVDRLDDMAKDHSVDHETRLSLRADIQRIKDRLGEEDWQPQAMAIFSCSGRNLYEEVPLPRRVHDKIVADERAYVRPMVAVLDEFPRSCVVVIDKASARTWELYQDELRELGPVNDRLVEKQSFAAGGEEQREGNKAHELTKRHYRYVAQILDELFRAGDYDLLIMGGHEFELPAFQEFMSRDLRDRLAGSFSFDPDKVRLSDIRAGANAVLKRYERDLESKLVAEAIDTLAAGRLAAVGLETCLWAGSIAAIQQLLVQEGATVPGVVCDESGWLALSGETCPLCGKPARHSDDVIDELVQAVMDEGGSIHHVDADTQLEQHVLAATLRFPLPPPPQPLSQ